jgi:hypothetical protein
MVGAVGLGPVGHFPEHLARARGPELAYLGVNALAVRRDSRVALNHGFFVHLISAPKKPHDFNTPILVHNSFE